MLAFYKCAPIKYSGPMYPGYGAKVFANLSCLSGLNTKRNLSWHCENCTYTPDFSFSVLCIFLNFFYRFPILIFSVFLLILVHFSLLQFHPPLPFLRNVYLSFHLCQYLVWEIIFVCTHIALVWTASWRHRSVAIKPALITIETSSICYVPLVGGLDSRCIGAFAMCFWGAT